MIDWVAEDVKNERLSRIGDTVKQERRLIGVKSPVDNIIEIK